MRHGLVALLVLGIWAVVAWWHPTFESNRWDNFEYFTPAILQAHNQWLAGELPAINPHQSLGEPLLPSGQPGVFYFPYTLSVLVLHTLGLPSEHLMTIVWALHLPWAALGMTAWLRALGVRFSFGVLTAVSVCFGGFVVSVALCWIFMVAFFAWVPWILWGLTVVLSGKSGRAAGLMIALGMAAVGHVGYPQMTVYVWLLAVFYALVFGLWVYRMPQRLLPAGALLVAGMLLAAPTWVPMMLALPQTVRAGAFGLSWFLERGVPGKVLLGWFCPLVTATTDFLRDRANILGYQGGWIVGGMVAGLGALRIRQQMSRVFIALAGLAALFTVFALGGNTPGYQLTYGLPVWSSFRWPFKFFLLSQVLVAVTAGVGLELGVQRWRRGWVVGIPLAVTIGLLALRIVNPGATGWGWFVLATALAVLAAVGWADRGWGRALLVAAGVLSAAATLSQCHLPGLKTYRERYGEAGRAELGIDPAYRVLPLTTARAPVDGEWPMQWLGLFHAASLNGYFSATGHTAGLVPHRLAVFLPARVDGSLPYGAAQVLLPSHLLRAFNVKYVLTGAQDEIAQALVEEAGGYTVARRWPQVVVYENRDALPRVFLAGEVRPFELAALQAGLLRNEAPVTTVYVEDWPQTAPQPGGAVRQATMANARAQIEVAAPEGGFLVWSQRYDPGWRAWVDGQPAPVRAVNVTVMGVVLPRGAQTVVFRYRTPGLRLGGVLALGGLVLMAISTGRSGSGRSVAPPVEVPAAGSSPATLQ